MKKITILTGARGQGKSSFLLDKFEGKPGVAGILSLRRENDRRYFHKLSTGEEWPMDGLPGDEGPWLEVGRFRFSASAFQRASAYFPVAAIMEGAGLFIADEAGPLELRGEGFFQMLKILISLRPGPDLLIVVREELVAEMKLALGIPDAEVFTPENFPADFSWSSGPESAG